MGGYTGQVDATGDSGGTHYKHLRRAAAGSAPHRTETR